MSVIGKRVQTDVDAVIQLQIFLPRLTCRQIRPVPDRFPLLTSDPTSAADDCPAAPAAAAASSHTAAARVAHSASTPSFTLQKLFRQPKVIKPFASAGKRLTGYIPAIQRVVTPEGVRQANRLLGVDRFVHAGRIEIGIAQAIVDRAQSRCFRDNPRRSPAPARACGQRPAGGWPAMCSVRSTRMSIWSSRICSATCSSLRPTMLRQPSAYFRNSPVIVSGLRRPGRNR